MYEHMHKFTLIASGHKGPHFDAQHCRYVLVFCEQICIDKHTDKSLLPAAHGTAGMEAVQQNG